MTFMENQMAKTPYATIKNRMQQKIDNLENHISNLDYSLEIMEQVVKDRNETIALQRLSLKLLQDKYDAND